MSAPAVVASRPMRWWDIEGVLLLEQELFDTEAWSETMFWSELAERSSRWYRVVDGPDGIEAYAGLCAYPPHEAYVQTIAVAPRAQRRGLGGLLLAELTAEAWRRGCGRLDLEVRADNDTAIGLYRRHGFTTVGVRRSYYQPSGTDALVMRRDRP